MPLKGTTNVISLSNVVVNWFLILRIYSILMYFVLLHMYRYIHMYVLMFILLASHHFAHHVLALSMTSAEWLASLLLHFYIHPVLGASVLCLLSGGVLQVTRANIDS